jgi:glucosyl-3-phosphoglycerate synthase
VFIGRLEKRYGLYLLDKANRSMKIVEHGPERFALDIVEIGDIERPPMLTIPAYRERRQLSA